jgi:hypothetical protein
LARARELKTPLVAAAGLLPDRVAADLDFRIGKESGCRARSRPRPPRLTSARPSGSVRSMKASISSEAPVISNTKLPRRLWE